MIYWSLVKLRPRTPSIAFLTPISAAAPPQLLPPNYLMDVRNKVAKGGIVHVDFAEKTIRAPLADVNRLA
jgi:hypothetical protein